MGIFDRVSRLIKSNANSAIDKLQDTGKEVEQLVLEMEAALKAARRETQKGMAAEKLAATRAADVEKQVAAWGQKAETAAAAGDDALAREALGRQQATEQDLALARKEHDEAAKTAAAQREGLARLEARLKEVKQKKGTIQAKIAYGKNENLSADALDEFDRMAGKIDDSEGRVEAERELAESMDAPAARDAETNAKLAKLGGGDVEDRLAALKRKLEEK